MAVISHPICSPCVETKPCVRGLYLGCMSRLCTNSICLVCIRQSSCAARLVWVATVSWIGKRYSVSTTIWSLAACWHSIMDSPMVMLGGGNTGCKRTETSYLEHGNRLGRLKTVDAHLTGLSTNCGQEC